MKMSFDSESARLIDRIQASAINQAKLAGANFISIDWVAKKLRRFNFASFNKN